VRYVARELALFGALMKRSDLAHECEWRLVVCNPSQTAVGARRITALPKPDYTALYIDVDLADVTGKLPIADILVGPSPMQQMTALQARLRARRHRLVPSHALTGGLLQSQTAPQEMHK
jgi:hypothetical protein